MSTRSIDPAGIALIKSFEGLVLKASDDGFGNATDGWGHTKGVKNGQVITLAQAETFLQQDLQEAGAQVLAALPGVTLNDNQYAALTSLVFNSGIGDLHNTQLSTALKAGNMSLAADKFLEFDHANGQVVAGLLRRCEAERLLFLTPSQSSSQGWVVVIGKTIAAQLYNDSAYAPLRSMCEALYGKTADTSLAWDEAAQQATWQGKSMGFDCRLIDGAAWAPIRPFALWAGCSVKVDGQTITLSHS